MRSRLAGAFVLLALLVLGVFTGVRIVALHQLIQDQEVSHLQQRAQTLVRAADTTPGGDALARQLRLLVADDAEATVTMTGAAPVTLRGTDFDPSNKRDDQLVARSTTGDTSVVVRQSSHVVRQVFDESLPSVLGVSAVLLVLAGIIGWVVASLFAAPFHRLAGAAASLGRGRFDLDLPDSRIPEAQAIADSLRGSASQLEHTFRREREVNEELSHRLRTPLTGIRLELEELQQDTNAEPQVRAGIGRALMTLGHLDHLCDTVLGSAQAPSTEVRIPLVQLGNQISDAWAHQLRDAQLESWVSTEGNVAQQVVPGPVEQVLDLVLADVRACATGRVRLTLVGSADQTGLIVHADPPRPGLGDRPDLEAVRRLVGQLAGHCHGDPLDGGLRIWLPRR